MRKVGKLPTVSYVCLIIFLIYIVGFLSHFILLGKSVYGDGIFYVSWLRSSVVDGDVRFANDYALFDVQQPLTPLGSMGNKYSIGPALLWAPTYLTAFRIFGGIGTEPVYQLVIGVTSVCYAAVGLLLVALVIRNLFGQTAALLTVLTLAGATNLLFYGSVDPVNSHSLSFFTVSVFLSLLLAKSRSWLYAGIALGVVGLVRPQDMLVGLMAIPFLIREKHSWHNIAFFLTGAAGAFLPQLWAWQALYGSMHSPYLGYGEGFRFFQPHLFGVLFSLQNGLLIYSPAMAYAGLGFFSTWKKIEFLKPFVLVVLIVQLYLISCWSTWWQGASYGIRMFVGMLPLIALPLAAFYASFTRQLRGKQTIFLWLIASLTFLNVMMIIAVLLRF